MPTSSPPTLRGLVRSADGSPLAGVTVRAFDRDVRAEQELGNSQQPAVTGNDGRFTIAYTSAQFARAEKGAADIFFRLFMAPGMGHCAGGPGPNQFDALTALEQWVEKGIAPDTLLASHSSNGKVDRTRPLCPYPQVARYKGTGSIDEASNFACVTPGAATPKKPTASPQ